MLKNSQILPVFGLGLILSTSPLFTLLDSSIFSPETVNEDSSIKLIDEEEVTATVEDTQPSSATTIESLPKEPSLESSTTEDESPAKEDSAKPKEPLTSTEDLSSQQQEPKEPTEDIQSKPKEDESTPATHSQVTESVTPDTTTTTTTESIPASSQPSLKVTSTSSSTPSLKSSGASPTTTPTNRVSRPSNTPKSSKSVNSRKRGWKRREYNRDYTDNKKSGTPGVREVLFNSGESKYLYSHDGELSFSIPKTLESQQKQFQKIPVDNIHISLFKTPAWSNSSAGSVDEYEEVSQDKVKELFSLVGNDQDKKKKLRQLLVSLSNRRSWSFHTLETTYKSELKEAEIVWKNGKDKENELEIKIKYLNKFEDLKDYINYKIDLCTEAAKGPCTASPDELTIIDQDKKTFFKDSKKKK